MKFFFLIAFLIPSFLYAQLPDISFASGNWTLSNGVTYNEFNGELTIEGNPNEYRRATIVVNIPSNTTDLYLSGNVFLENIVNGSNVWEKPKFKFHKTSGGSIKACNFTSPIENQWYSTFCHLEKFNTLGINQVEIEIGIQNASGTFKVKLPKLTNTEPTTSPYSFPFTIPTKPICELNLNSDSLVQFNNDLLSTNSHFSWANLSWSDQKIIDVINNDFPMSNLRFPGGTVGNFYNYLTDGYHNDPSTFESNSRKNLYNNGFKFGYNGFKNQVLASGGTATLMFNVMHDDVNTATIRLQSRINDGLNVKWVEFGNENYFSSQAYGYIASGWQVVDVDKYINHTKSLVNSLKQVSPSTKFVVNINHLTYDVNGWSDKISKDNYYDGTTMHNYIDVWDEKLNFASGKELFNSYKVTRKNIQEYKKHFKNTPTIITEWGIQGAPRSFLSVLAYADIFMALLEGNLQDGVVQQSGIHMFYHSDFNIPQSLIYLENQDLKYTPTGIFYAQLLKTFKNTSIYTNLSSSNELEEGLPAIISKAVDYGDSIKVFSVNKLPVSSELKMSLDNTVLDGNYTMQSFTIDPTSGWTQSYNTTSEAWTHSKGTGVKMLAPYSITVTTITKPLSITNINTTNTKGDLNIYPNPSSGDFVFIKNTSNNTRYEVYDLKGEKLQSGAYSESGINIKELNNGIYLLLIGGQYHRIILE